MSTRLWYAATAAAVVAGLVLQIVITVHAPAKPPAHAVGTLAGAPLATRLLRVVSFFTIQSNILCGIVGVRVAARREPHTPVWPALRLAALGGITVTGIVYATVLARVHEPTGWQQVVSNALFHYVVPLMAVLGWLVLGPPLGITVATIGRAAVWPVAWLGYTLLHGEASRWYPYPFVDVATHGYARVLMNVVGVLVVFAVVAGVIAWCDRRLARRGEAERLPA